MLDFILRPIRRNFGRNKLYYRIIDDMFGFIPNNIELYKLALIHKSASVEMGGRSINNERLEFLGDAVIESITSDYLFIEYPDYDEGRLTQLRSKIVSRQSLNAVAKKLGLDECIICNHTVSVSQKHIFGDAFEAMMGAIYLDQGYNFVNRLLINGSFGYRENPMYATNFIGDFDIRYLLTGGFSLKGYNKTNDRYFSRTSLTTQGLGLVFQRDFDGLLPNPKREQTTVAESNDSTMVTTKKKRKRK